LGDEKILHRVGSEQRCVGPKQASYMGPLARVDVTEAQTVLSVQVTFIALGWG
jgi:hypothetical protein